jgi:hypothetical protein
MHMTHKNSKTGSFPAPAIAKRSSQPESLNLDELDLSRDGIQGDAVVSKGDASTFVSRKPNADDDK